MMLQWVEYCLNHLWAEAYVHVQSRKHHETGLKHQGQKERFIRDIYKSGNQAKRDKEAEAIENARIERVSGLLRNSSRKDGV
jgi:WW domain-binding protein 4